MNTHPPAANEVNAAHRIRTLLVDDTPPMLKVTAEILKLAGNFDVVGSACNGYQALNYASTLLPDLILMDVHMPRLDGIQATRHIKRGEHPPIVVLVTSDDSPITRAAAELAGADGFVCKDANLLHGILDELRKLFGPPAETRGGTREDSAAKRVDCNENIQTEQNFRARFTSRCQDFNVGGDSGENPPARSRRDRRAWRSGTHDPARLARCGTTTQSKASK